MSGIVHIGIDSDRRLLCVPGYTVTRLSRFDDRVLTNTSPPRQRLEDALLDLAGDHDDELAAVQLLADAVRARLTTAARLRSALAARPRQSRRTWIGAVLADLDEGTCSVLERGYLVHVERAHGLPRGSRQVVDSTAGGRYVRDVRYTRYGMTVELNGRMFHDGSADWDRDLERELTAAAAGGLGLRLGWGQVFSRACRTAEALGSILRSRGWPDHPRRCSPDCTVCA
jgi:hypothetical protein